VYWESLLGIKLESSFANVMFVIFETQNEYSSSLIFSKVFYNRGLEGVISELSLSSEGRCQGWCVGPVRVGPFRVSVTSFGMDETSPSPSTPNKGQRKNRFAFITSC